MLRNTMIVLGVVCILLSCRSVPEPVDFHEPALKGNLKWNADLPAADFPAAADVVDVIGLRGSDPINATVCSLMAIVNAEQPRIAIAENGRVVQFNAMNIAINVVSDPYTLFEKYKSYITSAVIWDRGMADTLNLACTYAGIYNSIVMTNEIYEEFVRRGYDLQIGANYAGRFGSKLAVYNYMYNKLYPQCTRKVITSLDPNLTMKLRDYSMAVKSAIIWLSFDGAEGELANKFFSKTDAGNAVAVGWAPNGDEGGIVSCASRNGMYVWAADHSASLTFFAAKRGETPKIPVKSVNEFLNANGTVMPYLYVAIGVSDGDNLQYMQGAMFDKFNERQHKDARLPPLTWTINPAASDVIPVVYNYYIEKQASDYVKDGFMTGPSGVGYFYPYLMYDSPQQDNMVKFYEQTNRYCVRTGINSVSVWYKGVGDPVIPAGFMSLVAPKINNVSSMMFQRNMTPEVSDNVLFYGWTDPYNDNPVNNFKAQITNGYRKLEDTNTAQYVTLQAVPWDGRLLSKMIEVSEFAMKLTGEDSKMDGKNVIKFVTIDQVVQLQRIQRNLPRINSQ